MKLKTIKRWFRKKVFPKLKDLNEITDQDVLSACLSYRHDFYLLSEKERSAIIFEAKQWLHAWKKTIKDN